MMSEQSIPAFVTFLKPRKKVACNFSHGWIELKNGKSWHPDRDQSALLNGLCSKRNSLFSILIERFIKK